MDNSKSHWQLYWDEGVPEATKTVVPNARGKLALAKTTQTEALFLRLLQMVQTSSDPAKVHNIK